MENTIRKYFPNISSSAIEKLTELFIRNRKLKAILLQKYQNRHNFSNDTKLFRFANEIKKNHLKKSSPLHKVYYCSKVIFDNQALGMHHYRYIVQGKNIKRKNEIAIAQQFKNMPFEFLEHIVVHELAHLKEKDHDKKFYNLCLNMQENYYEISQDIRLYLIWYEITKEKIWD